MNNDVNISTSVTTHELENSSFVSNILAKGKIIVNDSNVAVFDITYTLIATYDSVDSIKRWISPQDNNEYIEIDYYEYFQDDYVLSYDLYKLNEYDLIVQNTDISLIGLDYYTQDDFIKHIKH